MPRISGTSFFIASSTPAFKVIGDIGQEPQLPSISNVTIMSSEISISHTFLPSTSKYGLLVYNATSTLLKSSVYESVVSIFLKRKTDY